MPSLVCDTKDAGLALCLRIALAVAQEVKAGAGKAQPFASMILTGTDWVACVAVDEKDIGRRAGCARQV
jgi:hypothetical protein